MSFMQNDCDSEEVTADARIPLREAQKKQPEQLWWTVLDDPSFRRLLRDGHRADATAYLLTQLEKEE